MSVAFDATPAYRDEDKECPECHIGNVGEDVVEVGEAEHEVAAEGVVEADVVVIAVGLRVDIREHNLH